MTIPTELTRADVYEAIEVEQAAWDELVQEVGIEHIDEPGFMGDWTFTDVAAHLTGWRERTIDRLQAASRAEPEPPPPWPAGLTGDDEINEWIFRQARSRPAQDLLQAAHDSYSRLRDAVVAVSLDDLVDPERFSWMDGASLGAAIVDRSFFDHLHSEHEPDIRARIGVLRPNR